MTTKVRFAPSPTGQLHVGNIRTALLNWLFARSQGGQFLLRIDDTDLERSTKAYEEGIFADLAWLGLLHDETAKQSDRFAVYDAAAEKLRADGFLYPCYETADELDRQRKLQRAQGKPPIYNRAALELDDTDRLEIEKGGRKAHWRFKLSGEMVVWNDVIRGEQHIDTASLSDPVLIRADGSYLYTLPSVVDDTDLGISHIIRGEDHVTNSAAQIEIFRALGATPPQMGHHPLLVGADGTKLSKRLGTLSIAGLRDDELIEPMAILSLLAKIGTSDPVEIRHNRNELVAEFSFDKIGRAPARFDGQELKLLNAKLLHEMPYAQVQERLAAMNVDGGKAFWDVVRVNLTTLADVQEWYDITFGEAEPDIAGEDREFCEAAAALLPNKLSEESWVILTGALKEQTGRKGKGLFLPLRKALTGKNRGPEMAALLPLIGSEKARARLHGRSA